MVPNFQIKDFLRQIAAENSKYFKVLFQGIFFVSSLNKIKQKRFL
jgi:hypothetical protein